MCLTCISYASWSSIAHICACVRADASGNMAAASRRGGGEYGIAWREAGSCANKQNVFDDFIACAEFLQAEGYTRPGKLVIQAGLILSSEYFPAQRMLIPSKPIMV